MKDFGRRIFPMKKGNKNMGIFYIMAILCLVRKQGKEPLLDLALNTKEYFQKINLKGKGFSKQTNNFMKDNFSMAKNMDKEFGSINKKTRDMMVSFNMTKNQVLAFFTLKMVTDMKDNSKMIKWMVRVKF